MQATFCDAPHCALKLPVHLSAASSPCFVEVRKRVIPANVPVDVIKKARRGTVNCLKAGYRRPAP